MRDDLVLHVVVPETLENEIPEQPRADDLELSSEDSSSVDVPEREGKDEGKRVEGQLSSVPLRFDGRETERKEKRATHEV